MVSNGSLVISVIATTTLALSLGAPASARAEEPDRGAPAAEAPDDLLAFGIGAHQYGGGLVGGPPQGMLTFERRITGPLWLMTRVDGGYGGITGRDSDGSGFTQRLLDIEGAVGLRVALTSPKIVELSAYALGMGGYSTLSIDGTEIAHSALIGAQAGFALDREIARGFGLRVSTPVVSAFASKDTLQGGARNGISVGFAPALELRWTF